MVFQVADWRDGIQIVEASCDISGHCILSNKQSFALAALRVGACAKGWAPRQKAGRASDVKFRSNTLTVVEPVQPMFNMENLCLRPSGSCGCGERDVKPKMMMK